MSFANLLKHEVIVQRVQSGMPDRYGHAERTWVDGDPVPAFVDDQRGREVNGPVLGGTTITDVWIFLNPMTPLPGEQDRIKDVTAGHGGAVYDIRHVKPAYRATSGALHHLEVYVEVAGTGEEPAS